MNYDPKFSIKQMYDQYSSSRPANKPNPGQQYAQTMKAGGGGSNMSGLGAGKKPNQGSTYDEVPDKPEETGITKTVSNFFSSLFDSGADEDSFSNIGNVNVTPVSLYDTDRFNYDPTRYTKPIDFGKQNERIDDMLNNRSDDPSYKSDQYAGSTYDEVLKQIKPEKAPPSMTDSINNAVRKGIMATTPTGNYKIKDGDTLGEIAEATGTTVEELKNLNKIENENIIRAGADLKIPVQTAEQQEIVSNATSIEDLETTKDFKPTQSGVPAELRTEPEDTSDLNNPQTQESMIPTDPMSAQEESFERKGIMSPTKSQPEDGTTTTDATEAAATFTSTTEDIYSDFVADKQEGDKPHVGQDNKNITLAGGIVADGLKYNGKDFKQGTTVVTNFDATKLDTSGATKTVAGNKVKRSDYTSDEEFGKAVIKAFEDEAKKQAGTSWSGMDEGSKKAVIKIGYNLGEGWYDDDSTKAIYKELAKDNPVAANLYSKILKGSTLDPSVSNGGASLGVSKARANAWNETIDATGGTEITKIVADNSGTNTAFKYYDAAGTLLHTEQTDRATGKYANKSTVVEKDSAGNW